eukprot:gene17103-20330_t
MIYNDDACTVNINTEVCLSYVFAWETLQEGEVLQRRFDPYTIWSIPVLQIMHETGELVLASMSSDEEVAVSLYTANCSAANMEVLYDFYSQCLQDGVTTCYDQGWYTLSKELYQGFPTNWYDVWRSFYWQDPCSTNWPGVDCDEEGRITHLQMRAIQGSIPTSVKDLTELRTLHLEDSILEALIPEIAQLSNLMLVRMESAELSGSLPEAFSSMRSLRKLKLGRNSLSGEIPASLLSNSELNEVDLSYNQLSGLLPSGLFYHPTLLRADFSHNLLWGTLPDNTADSTHLQELSLAYNEMSGEVPACWPSTITSIDLSYNSFSGFAHKCGLGPTVKPGWGDLPQLRSLLLSHNRLPWDPPEGLSELPALETVDLAHNHIRAQFVDIFEAFKASVPGLVKLDVSNNELFGDIAQTTK